MLRESPFQKPSMKWLSHGVALSLYAQLVVVCVIYMALPSEGSESVKIASHEFTLPDGYAVELAVPSSLVPRPIHMAFDNEGVLYVTDSSGNTDKAPVQLADPKHRILRVTDTDGDGVFDASSVFAEGLPFPEGILVHEGVVYVSAPPHIWKLRDTNGDEVADERTSWFDGGSIDGCGNDLHGPYLGADGYFYWTKGGFQFQTHQLGSGKTHRSNAAHIYRARSDGSQLEVVITGGMNNPVGLAFSESGERFLSGTFFDLSAPGKRDGVLHAIYGGVYGRENPRALAPHPRTGDLLPPMTHLGPAAPSGIVMARSDALGLEDDLLCADFNLRRISRHRLVEKGSSYEAETSVFLESDRMDFHPTDVIEDADGSLLVADTGSWYMICCPTSKVAKPHVLGGIYRVKKTGVVPPRDPRGLELDWENPELTWLNDTRPAVVNRAIEALADERFIEALQQVEARVPALWVLHRIPEPSARKAVRDFLQDENPEARAAALHSVALWRDPEAADAVIELLQEGTPHERRLASMALGRMGETRATEALLELSLVKEDPFLKHAATFALYEMGGGVSLPDKHPVSSTVSTMHEVVKKGAPVHPLPEIELAEEVVIAPDVATRQEARLAELSALLPKADAERGKEIFYSATKSLCLTCHVMGDQGVEFGPDLTKIGAIRSQRDLLEAIVYPSATIARYFEMVIVKKKKRGEAAGLIRRESTDHLVLASAPGIEQPVPIRDIGEAQYSSVSLMPEVFDALLTSEEIADLVSYLSQAK
ncbi:HEAT repeat domain-containing protein [Akkermansiaceae bacterium]|nr:HEAT repeat domain-containing protein [Akkermansiaceae bacterium]